MEAQRWNASQAQREQAAISGRLGLQSQIIALAEVYRELRAAGKMAEAAEIKRRANLMVTEKPQAQRPLPMNGNDYHHFGEE